MWLCSNFISVGQRRISLGLRSLMWGGGLVQRVVF